MLDTKLELLQQLPIFSGLSALQVEAVAAAAEKVYFEAGSELISNDKPGHASYVILTGKAGCLRAQDREAVETDLWPGTLVGELAMLVETVHTMTVTAKERVRALSIGREPLRKVMEADPEIAGHMADVLLERLRVLATELRTVDGHLAAIEQAAA